MMCPLCGAEQRLGVWLPRMKVKIVDRVVKAGRDGIPGKVLAERLGMTRTTLNVHVKHINDFLEETDWVIRGKPGSHESLYRLQKR